jgi:predicted component of type VI protein secretion system
MQGSDSFRLVVRRGPQPNHVYELNKDIITVGRDITNDIVINDPEVSRHHMRFTRGAGGFTLEDLGSTNGTFINGQRLTGAKPLNNGDMIGLGETVTLAYESVGPARDQDIASAAPVSPYARQPEQAPSSPSYAAPAYQQQPAPPPYSYEQQQPAYDLPPQSPPLYDDYDPYAAREEEPRNTMRWVLIGCVGLSLFCCCATVAGLVIIDQACLWDQIPILNSMLRAFGWVSTC